MNRLTAILCLTLMLTGATAIWGRDPKTHQSRPRRPTSHSSSQKLVWDANPIEERIACYNVYEKIDHGSQPPTWKRIATVNQPSFSLRELTRGTHILSVTACSKSGESARSAEMVVTK